MVENARSVLFHADVLIAEQAQRIEALEAEIILLKQGVDPTAA